MSKIEKEVLFNQVFKTFLHQIYTKYFQDMCWVIRTWWANDGFNYSQKLFLNLSNNRTVTYRPSIRTPL